MRNGPAWLSVMIGCVCGSAILYGDAPHFKEGEHWNCYADFLYMGRSALHNRSLVVEDGAAVLHTKRLQHQHHFEPGYRVGLTYMPNVRNGFEGNFTHLTPWEGSRGKKGRQSLSFPFDDENYDENFTNADRADAHYRTRFWNSELNFWHYFTSHRSTYFGLSGLIGLRFFSWDDFFSLWMQDLTERSSYKIKTKNRLLSAQVGLDFQMHPMRWLTWELLAKGGAFANSAEQSQFLGDDNNLVTIRHSSTQKWQPGFFGDVSAQMRVECGRYLNLHVGYEALFLTGLALAPEQISRAVSSGAGKEDRTHGNGIIQGLFAGLTLRF